LREGQLMDRKKITVFRERLKVKKEEILEAFTKNKNYGKEANGEPSQDIADQAADSYTKEFLFSLSSSERKLLRQVDEALSRIQDRCYGVCASCEDSLNLKRLQAVPWATLCLKCQEKQEMGLL
jgi:DnaK suppressor protein